ncbi:hypothetical protein [uncultured Ruthenibacterium sp.]|uniref:hypothetical protein n=1 Tax=uncultured Ruthenibacterium sp. TaxID=1905347 RepID=UPI00349EC129
MKKFLVKLFAFALCLLLPFVGYFSWIQSKPAAYTGSLMGSVHVKSRLLESTPGARIIVVGGSSVPYSICCETVSEAANMPCINLGATAYLGLEYYTALLEPLVHEGDIIVFAPEFSMFENVVSYTTAWMAVENDLSLIKALPLSYYPDMIQSFYSYSRQKLAMLAQGEMQSYKEEYESFGFGPWGDLTFERENILEDKYNTQDCRAVDADTLSPRVINALNHFAKKAQEKGARVCITFAPFNQLAFTGTQEGLLAFENKLTESCGTIPVISSVQDSLMDENLFFNSNNHLNSEGMTIRTEKLIDDLRNAGFIQ